MSFHHVSAAMKLSEEKGSARLVLFVLAHHASDQHEAFPSIATICEEARVSRSTALDTLAKLVKSGAIERVGPHPDPRFKGTVIYRLPDPWGSGSRTRPDLGPVRNAAVYPSGDRTQKEELQTTIDGVVARARGRRLEVGGKSVSPERWETTLAILGEYNAASGSRLSPLTGAGEPSDAAKRIYAQVVQWPGLSLARHREVIEFTLGSKWWGDGPPSVGVVYGPKIWETNLARTSPSPEGSAGRRRAKESKSERTRRRLEFAMTAQAAATLAGDGVNGHGRG